MSVLAFKALHTVADRIPDRFFESVPGGFFTPPDKKKARSKRKPPRDEPGIEHRRCRSQRGRSPPSDSSPRSGHDDTDDQQDHRPSRRCRAKSLGHSASRSLSRGRNRQRSSRDRARDSGAFADMDRPERGPQQPPSPTTEYRPYNPQEYQPETGPGGAYPADPYDRRASSARPEYGYPPQVNASFRSYSTSGPPQRPQTMPPGSTPPTGLNRPPSRFTPSPFAFRPPATECLACRSPFSASFSPSYDPPMAAKVYHSTTNTRQPSDPHHSVSSSAAKYTPSSVNSNASAPYEPDPGYAPYNPADYAPHETAYRAPGNTYPSPPPFYRQESRSQPALPQAEPQNQLAYFDPPPDRHGSTSSSSRRHHHGHGKHHRTRSAGHGRSSSRVTDQLRDRFGNLDAREKDLAASVGGALAGAAAGRAVGKDSLSTLLGAAIGGLGGREFERRNEKKKASRDPSRGDGRSQDGRSRSHHSSRKTDRSPTRSRSRSRNRRRDDRHDDYDSYSDSESEDRRRAARRRRRRSSRRRDSLDY